MPVPSDAVILAILVALPAIIGAVATAIATLRHADRVVEKQTEATKEVLAIALAKKEAADLDRARAQ